MRNIAQDLKPYTFKTVAANAHVISLVVIEVSPGVLGKFEVELTTQVYLSWGPKSTFYADTVTSVFVTTLFATVKS